MNAVNWTEEAWRPRWWAGVLAFAASLGVVLGVLGPYGSFWNDNVGGRVVCWAAMMTQGAVIAGLLIPLVMRAGATLGLPKPFSLAVGIVAASGPIHFVVWLTARAAWPRQIATLTAMDRYTQTLTTEICGVVLWMLFRMAWHAWGFDGGAAPGDHAGAARVAPDQPAQAHGDLIALQMEDHYVRLHRVHGSTMELMPMEAAIQRYGQADGLRVHRSWWVASSAVARSFREGRNWKLQLISGSIVPVARNRLIEARAKGWLDTTS